MLRACLTKDRRRRISDIAAVTYVLDHHADAAMPLVPSRKARAGSRVADGSVSSVSRLSRLAQSSVTRSGP